MKYLIVSDIHGSIDALDAVLQHFERERCDMLLLLGDLLNYGPRNSLPPGLDPRAVAERLNTLADRIVCVRGNCDSEVDQMLLDFPVLADYAWV
ncbi:phosphodiesterase, partial [Enterobacter hormaechei]|uniref:phosphodiesterase n=1 Tax=Enterobacter hormaechei TaxID=158836 RepID=UPI00123AB070